MRIHALLFLLLTNSAWALYGARPVASQKHLVKLQVNEKVFCQGVVISATKVLTAGHCIEGMGLSIRENVHHLTYYPETVSVHSGRQAVRAKTISFTETMFDSHGIMAEDLALIELEAPLTNVDVLPFAAKSDLTAGSVVTLSANGKEANVKIRQTARGDESFVIITEGSASGVCQGDSGGALILTKNGKKYLAGILAARAEGCRKLHSVSYYPRRQI